MGVNIDGAYYCIQAFLPAMRQQGGGTIVNIVSDAAVAASAKAGAAYVASKFAMRGLTQSINAEERAGGRGDVSKTHVKWRQPVGASYCSPVLAGPYLYFFSDRATEKPNDQQSSNDL